MRRILLKLGYAINTQKYKSQMINSHMNEVSSFHIQTFD